MRRLVLAAVLASAGAAGAVDAPPSDALPDLAPARALIAQGDYAAAAADLSALAERARHADIYNLLGFSLRKLGRSDEAGRWYEQALYYDPAHRSALEYQGELFLQIGRPDRARENLGLLALFCPEGCEELDDLRAAIAAADQP